MLNYSKELPVQNYFTTRLHILNQELSLEDREDFLNRSVEYLQSIQGFPYYTQKEVNITKELQKMISFDSSKIKLLDDDLQQFMLGLNLVNLFHPQMWNIKCSTSKTALEVFNSKDFLKKALDKRLKMSDCSLTLSNLRKSLRIYSGTQVVSNFRPTIAKYIYENYCPENGTVLDCCMGFSGRLLGAYSSKNVIKYVGVDPCDETFWNNINAIKEFSKFESWKKLKTDFHKFAFENVKINEKFDLVFTSPPYFNIEKYSNEDTQSWIRYKTYDEWSKKFLKVLIEKSFEMLKDNCYFILNIPDSIIKDDSIKYAESIGFSLQKVYKMRLSKMCGVNTNKNVEKYKYEPILVFKKLK